MSNPTTTYDVEFLLRKAQTDAYEALKEVERLSSEVGRLTQQRDAYKRALSELCASGDLIQKTEPSVRDFYRLSDSVVEARLLLKNPKP